MFKNIILLKGLFKKKIQEMSKSYNDSQNPYIWKVRDKLDSVSITNNYGIGITIIQRDFNINFWPNSFILKAENDIVPIFAQKYFEGDMKWLRLACTSEAESVCFASIQER